jgi:hypothetical protein
MGIAILVQVKLAPVAHTQSDNLPTKFSRQKKLGDAIFFLQNW